MTSPRLSLPLLALLLCGSALRTAAAQDTLYQAAPPSNAAFVRVANALGGAPIRVTLAGRPFGEALAARGVGAYQVVPQGTAALGIVGLSLQQPLTLVAGHFYTLALSGSRPKPVLTVLGESASPSVTQARLSFYNLSAAPDLSLLTSDGRVTLFKNLTPLSARSLNVNPVNVQLRVDGAAKTLSTLAAARLQARASYSVFVFGPSPLDVSWVPSTTRP